MIWTELLGYAAALAVLATFCMKTMRPLRIVALGSNVLFALYGFYDGLYPVLALHLVLFPVNLVRLIQAQRLVRRVQDAAATDLSAKDILPLMHRRRARAGETVFRKGDVADRLYYVGSGSVVISESGVTIKAGEVFGEIGLFAPDRKRTASIVAATECELYELTEAKAHELYFQNPAFGFALLRLIVARLLDNARNVPRPSPLPLPQAGEGEARQVGLLTESPLPPAGEGWVRGPPATPPLPDSVARSAAAHRPPPARSA